MTTTGADWNDDGNDMHVLAGTTSRRLDSNYLILNQQGGPNVFAYTNPNDHTTCPVDVDKITFVPRFAPHGPQPANSVANDLVGVTVDTDTGAVTVASPPPAGTRLRSFLIVATVQLKAPNAATVFKAPIRVHVHESIRSFWLTPPRLTLYKGLDGWRFSCLAEFNDDRTVGDLSWLPGITWTLSPTAAGKLDFVDPAKPGLKPTASPASNIDVTATLPADWGGGSATAKVDIKDIPTITAVPAGSPAGKPADVPNVLIVAEGFQAAEKSQFVALAGQFIQEVRTNAATRPYDLLPINYWLAFLPSPDRGVTIVEAVSLVKGKTKTFEDFANEVEPSKPAGTAWELGELLFEVGRPIPADHGVARATKLGQWQALYGAHITNDRVPQALYDEWQGLVGWRLPNERNSALGLSIGRRPSVAWPDDLRPIRWSKFRMSRTQFDTVLDNVKDSSGGAIGASWKAGAKDQPLVFALCGGAPSSGSQTAGQLIASGIVPKPIVAVLNLATSSNAADVAPFPLPSSVSLDARATLTHEISHAFGLDDEYGESKDQPPGKVLDYSKNGNLLSLADVQTAGQIDGNKIKWRWPRIRTAGILQAAPNPVGGSIDLVMRTGHTAGFKKDQIVRLRTRDLLSAPVLSQRLKITAVSVSEVITIEAAPGEVVDGNALRNTFPAGSVLIEPVRAPDPPGALGDDRELVAPVILAHINAQHSPLNRATGAACAVDGKAMQLPVNLPPRATMRKVTHDAWIVGLYDGGDAFHCGVFHAAGICLMRQLTVAAWVKVNPGKIYPLCEVCRYVLVDRLDPRKHRTIDKDYQSSYPQP